MNSGLFFLGRHWASSYMSCILHFRAGTGAPPLRFYPRIFHPRHLLNPRFAFGVAGTDPYSLSTCIFGTEPAPTIAFHPRHPRHPFNPRSAFGVAGRGMTTDHLVLGGKCYEVGRVVEGNDGGIACGIELQMVDGGCAAREQGFALVFGHVAHDSLQTRDNRSAVRDARDLLVGR